MGLRFEAALALELLQSHLAFELLFIYLFFWGGGGAPRCSTQHHAPHRAVLASPKLVISAWGSAERTRAKELQCRGRGLCLRIIPGVNWASTYAYHAGNGIIVEIRKPGVPRYLYCTNGQWHLTRLLVGNVSPTTCNILVTTAGSVALHCTFWHQRQREEPRPIFLVLADTTPLPCVQHTGELHQHKCQVSPVLIQLPCLYVGAPSVRRMHSPRRVRLSTARRGVHQPAARRGVRRPPADLPCYSAHIHTA
jgi:hypothetical protein